MLYFPNRNKSKWFGQIFLSSTLNFIPMSSSEKGRRRWRRVACADRVPCALVCSAPRRVAAGAGAESPTAWTTWADGWWTGSATSTRGRSRRPAETSRVPSGPLTSGVRWGTLMHIQHTHTHTRTHSQSSKKVWMRLRQSLEMGRGSSNLILRNLSFTFSTITPHSLPPLSAWWLVVRGWHTDECPAAWEPGRKSWASTSATRPTNLRLWGAASCPSVRPGRLASGERWVLHTHTHTHTHWSDIDTLRRGNLMQCFPGNELHVLLAV